MSKELNNGVLIIDDEESLRCTFEMFLKREGYSPVVAVATYEDALKEIEEKEFDIIISDILLEGSSGMDILKKVKELGHTCPVVMITGYPNIKTASEAVRLGAFDYLPKPVTKDALLKVTRLAIKHNILQKEKEEAEKEKEKYRIHLQTIFKSVKDLIITVDNGLKIIEMNPSAQNLFFDGADFHGKIISEIPRTIGKSCFNDAKKVIQSKQEILDRRVECERPDGQKKVFSMSTVPLMETNNIYSGAVIVIRDMTRIEELEERGKKTKFHRFIGKSPAMQMVYTLIENVGKVDAAVLITGESGTGKELVAEALHLESPRAARPFVKFDCTSIPDDLLESELFGHKKGAFTGAQQDRMGRILQADGGTLFLDEIGDISLKTQLKLLRFLQEKTFYPVGRDQPIQVDVRVIAATNANLKKKVQEGAFREDLYFRLRVVEIMLPPLRERKEDISLLIDFFLKKFSEKMGKEITGLSEQVTDKLLNYPWPGNVRELEHVIERAIVLCNENTISTNQLAPDILSHKEETEKISFITKKTEETIPDERPLVSTFETTNETPEVQRIIDALKRTAGNKAKAARILGIDRSTLYRKIKDFRIEEKDFEV